MKLNLWMFLDGMKGLHKITITITITPVSKVIKDRNQITIQQVIRLQSWGYVLITITDFDLITIVL